MATEIARVQRPAPAFEGTAVINGAFQSLTPLRSVPLSY